RWPDGYAYTYDTLADPDVPPEQRPHVIGRQRLGRVTIANSDAGAAAFTNQAMDEAHRAVQELYVLNGLDYPMRCVICLMAYFLVAAAYAQNAPEQPLPYSHKTHLANGLKCQDCHTNPDPGERMGFPNASRCMLCHSSVAKEKPSIQKLAEYAK